MKPYVRCRLLRSASVTAAVTAPCRTEARKLYVRSSSARRWHPSTVRRSKLRTRASARVCAVLPLAPLSCSCAVTDVILIERGAFGQEAASALNAGQFLTVWAKPVDAMLDEHDAAPRGRLGRAEARKATSRDEQLAAQALVRARGRRKPNLIVSELDLGHISAQSFLRGSSFNCNIDLVVHPKPGRLGGCSPRRWQSFSRLRHIAGRRSQ